MKVLVADDNHFYRVALRATLREWGYEVLEAENGKQAFDILSGADGPKLAILDWIMPGLSGPELCKRIRSLHQPESPYLIILTCVEGPENSVSALQAGADDFVHKPFDKRLLQARLQVGERIVKLQASQAMIFTLARAAEAKSPYTKGHSDRVTHYALCLAQSMNLEDKDLQLLRRGGLLHDIGKIGIPDAILDKPGALSPEEFKVIKQHPTLGVDILKPLQSLDDVLPLVRWHHERCDGKGYPDGLTKKDIPYLVRLLSVADVYDAFASARPYRGALSHEECLQIMQKSAADGGLDPDLVEQFTLLTSDVFGQKINHFHLKADSLPIKQVMPALV